MERALGAAVILLSAITVASCGDSISTLNRLAAVGSIHEDAPVTAHLQVLIAAPPERVWALLIDAATWPKWQPDIESAAVDGQLAKGAHFSRKTGGVIIRSQVQLFAPEHRLSWTGTSVTVKAVHVWELTPQPSNQTLVTMKESMDGPLIAKLFPPQKLAEGGNDWLIALKKAAEQVQ